MLQLIQQINELVASVQYIPLGKLPINIIDQKTAYNILRNLTLQLPERYELIIGNNVENIHEYYHLIEVATVGDIHGIKLIMNIHLKTTNSYFSLYKTTALPTRIPYNKFVKCVFDYPYFDLDKNQYDYIVLSKADLLRYRTSSMTILCYQKRTCSAIEAVLRFVQLMLRYSTQV